MIIMYYFVHKKDIIRGEQKKVSLIGVLRHRKTLKLFCYFFNTRPSLNASPTRSVTL